MYWNFNKIALAGCLIILQIILCPNLFAREDVIPGSRFTSARGAAMGDAYLPVGEDGASGLFYNPANIGKIRTMQFEPLNLSIYSNSGYINTLGLDFYKVFTLAGYLPTLQANPEQNVGLGFSVFPNAYMRGVAFGVLLQSQVNAQVNADGSVSYKSMYQLIPTVGVGLRLASGIVRLGYSAQWVHQASGDITEDATADPLGYNEKLMQGSALSHNAGFALTLPISFLPSLNIVARNILTTSFSSFTLIPLARNSQGLPADEPTTFDGALGITSKIGGGSYANFVVNWRDMFNVSGISIYGRMAVGLEIAIKDLVFLRGGWGSGYPHAGLGLKRKNGEFSLAWYSEEIGSGYLTKRDMRWMMHYQVKTF